MGGGRRGSPVQEIEAALEKRIESFRKADGRLPSETQLSAEFGVSRVTLREALSSLEKRGLVIRKQGLGTFVNLAGSNITTRLDECIEYSELIRRAGYEAALSFFDWHVASLPHPVAEALQVEPGTASVYMRKVFAADGAPVILCNNYIPLALLPSERHVEVLDQILPHLSVYSIVARWFNHEVTHQLSEVSARTADADAARVLRCAPGNPLLAVIDIGFTDNQRPVFYGDTSFVPGHFHFQLVRKAVYANT